VTSLSVKIRLARHGAKKAPFYRVVIADERSRRNGRYIELVGRYDPRANPSIIDIDIAKVDEWLSKGAQPTEAAAKLIAAARGDKAVPEKEAKLSKRAVAKAEAEEAEKAEAEAQAKEKAAAEKAAKKEAEEAAKAEAEAEEAAKAAEAEASVVAEEAEAVVEEVAETPAEPVEEAVADDKKDDADASVEEETVVEEEAAE
jgi:small subunit ribosomal protein S16